MLEIILFIGIVFAIVFVSYLIGYYSASNQITIYRKDVIADTLSKLIRMGYVRTITYVENGEEVTKIVRYDHGKKTDQAEEDTSVLF